MVRLATWFCSALNPSALVTGLCFFVFPAAAIAQTSQPATSAVDANNWRLFRGDAQHTGVSVSSLPGEPVVLWKRDFVEPISSTAAIVGDVVYVGCDDSRLRALSVKDGRDIWTYEAKGPVRSAPSAIGDGVYFGDELGVFHALDAATGKLRWMYETGDQIISAAVPLPDNGLAFGSYDGFVYCLSAADGRLIWKHETAGKVHGTPGVTPDGRRLLVAGCDEYFYVLDVANGAEIAKISAGSPTGASAAITGDRVYIGTYGQEVLGIDWRKGEVLWRFEDPDRQFPYGSSAALLPDAILIGGRDKRLRCLDAITGKQRWDFAARGRIDSSPVILGERVFVGASDGNLYSLAVGDGRETWRYEAGGAITASPAIAGGRLIIGTENGTLYCFGSQGPN